MVDKRKARRWCGFLIEPHVVDDKLGCILVHGARGNRYQKRVWKLYTIDYQHDHDGRTFGSWFYVASIPQAKIYISKFLMEKTT